MMQSKNFALILFLILAMFASAYEKELTNLTVDTAKDRPAIVTQSIRALRSASRDVRLGMKAGYNSEDDFLPLDVQGNTLYLSQLDWESEYLPNGWWTHDDDGTNNGEYVWGRDDFLPFAGAFSGWCARGGQNGLDPEINNYPANSHAWLTFGPFDLTDALEAGFSFNLWNHSQQGEDLIYWGASTNGTTFEMFSLSGNIGWQELNVDLRRDISNLGDLAGKDGIYVNFIFESNADDITDKGAFLDNIKVFKIPRKVYPPRNLSATVQQRDIRLSWRPPLGMQESEELKFDLGQFEGFTKFVEPYRGVFAVGPFSVSNNKFPIKLEKIRICFGRSEAFDAFADSIKILIYADSSGTQSMPDKNLLIASSTVIPIKTANFFQDVDISLMNVYLNKGVFFVGVQQLGKSLPIKVDFDAPAGNAFNDPEMDGTFGLQPTSDGALAIRAVISYHGELSSLRGYNIYRSAESPVVPILTSRLNTALVTDTSYIDMGVSSDRAYSYAISAMFDSKETELSNEINVSVPSLASARINLNPLLISFEKIIEDSPIMNKTLSIANDGEKILHWQAFPITASEGEWLSLSPDTGTVAGGDSQEVVVSIDARNLQPGDYNGHIKVSDALASNSPQRVEVNLKIVDNKPPIISSLLPNESAAWKTPIAVAAIITDNSDQAIQAILYYRKGGAYSFTDSTTMSNAGDKFNGIIPESYVGEYGIIYYVKAFDSSQNISRSDTVALRIAFPSSTFKTTVNGGTETAEYRMISCPGYLNDSSPSAILVSKLGEYDAKVWRLFQYLGFLTEYPDIENFAPGKAFWLISKNNSTIDFGTGQTVSAGKDFEVVLKPGWSQIANPFAFIVDWNSAVNATANANLDGWAYHFSKEYHPATSIEPTEGYFVKNMSSDKTLTLKIPPIESPRLQKANMPDNFCFDGGTATLRIEAIAASGRDTYNFLGFADQAKEERDKLDHCEPPAIASYVSLFFPHIDWESYPDNYTTDFRPASTRNQYWDFTVKSNLNREIITLRFSIMLPFDSQSNIILYDLKNLDSCEIADQKEYKFLANFSNPERHFRLVVGDDNFVQSNSASIVPDNFIVMQNYPNPFNPTTTISYRINKPCRVKINIYNLLGKKVKTLVNSQKVAGKYNVIWNATNDAGQKVSSGIYFYKLEIKNQSLMHKMVLMK